jgi:hypothetical protein
MGRRRSEAVVCQVIASSSFDENKHEIIRKPFEEEDAKCDEMCSPKKKTSF